jgi:hypothetical protein
MTVGKVHLTKRFARYRIKNPSQFKKSTLRTQPLGTHGTKRITGKLKQSNKWDTQAILIPRKRYKAGERVTMVHGRPNITHAPNFQYRLRFLK